MDKATEDVKNFISKLRSLIITLYPELKSLRTYKYVVQSVFHKELFSQLTPTLGDLYSIKTEDKQTEFAKYMGMWQNLSCKDFGASDDFIQFCLIPSLRPPLLSTIKHDPVHDENKQENHQNLNPHNDENNNHDTKMMSGLSKQLNKLQKTQKMSNYSQLDPVNDEEEKESEIVHNAEPSDDIIIDEYINNDKSEKKEEVDNNNVITNHEKRREQEFDDNYAISQLLIERGCLHATHDTKENNLNNANFAIPEYVNEYNIDDDDDDESFIEHSSLNESIAYDMNMNSNNHDNDNNNGNNDNNVLSMLSPTASSLSSIDYDPHSDNNIQSSPDSAMTNSEVTYQSKTDHDATIQSILPQINDETESKNIENKDTSNNKPKRNRISSIFSAFSSKKKSKKPRSNSVDLKIESHKYNKYQNMNNASKLIEKGRMNSHNKKSEKINLKIGIQAPKINVLKEIEYEESHTSKRIHGKLNKSGIRYKDTIDDMTKQMLAGSHAGRIANQLHNINNRRATVHVQSPKHNNNNHDYTDNDNDNYNDKAITNGIKINNNTNKNKLHGINETHSKSLTPGLNFSPNSNKLLDKVDVETETEKKEKEEQQPERKKEGEEGVENKEEEKDKEIDDNNIPYLSAVLEIKKMPHYETPEDKIQCVVRTANICRETIDKYYENRRVDPIQITPDDLLSLFAYILTQANLHCLWAEVDLIDDFVVDNLRMDMPGYYIATLRAAMQLIVNDIEKLTRTSIKKRSSMKQIKT